ncbi:ubiquitin thioesterase otubain-like isoform X2 [Brevipalpus obovatus]|uniref:ubiquitin thioesterase otubain-like isoform X2 n=1 Tax=Brevipalpus obovatus TaxID=246614 RepID=UPI003D9E3F9C
MVKETAYYDILGLSPSAAVDEILAAYRDLAPKYHPDNNPKEKDKFQAISVACEALINEDTRKIYDQGGEEALQETGGDGPLFSDPLETFEMIFGQNKSEELNQDEAIIAQEKNIEKEIAENSRLVSDKMPLTCLLNEYMDEHDVYRVKIKNLSQKYNLMRRTRPDGNCFFRGFTYAYFEYLLRDRIELERFIKVANQSKQDLIDLGFPKFTIEDIQENSMNVLNIIKNKTIESQDQLLKLLNEPGTSDYLVVFMRLLTSGYLQKNEEFYCSFIDGETSMKNFCSHEVEPMYKESDHIHIIALTSATGVGVRIHYLDRGQGDEVTVHNFPDDCDPKIHLLYRPGHYDILYPTE